MSVSYVIEINETEEDVKRLRQEKCSLVFQRGPVIIRKDHPDTKIAKSDPTAVANEIGSKMEVSWTGGEYALNYVQEIPVAGAPITPIGQWQSIKPGEIYVLKSDGTWDSPFPLGPGAKDISFNNQFQPLYPVLAMATPGGHQGAVRI